MTLYEGIFELGNYKQTFTEKVDELTIQDFTDEFKVKLSGLLIDAYVEQTGKVPDSTELTRLADWLVEDKENDPDKITNNEFPILSTVQMKLRWRRETVKEGIEDTSASAKHKLNGKRTTKKKVDCEDTGFTKGGYN